MTVERLFEGGRYIGSPEGIKALHEARTRYVFKNFVESYRCRICKKPLNLENFGGLGENHMIFCKDCRNEV